MLRRIAIRILAIAGTVLLGAIISATLVRMAPGFESDEHQLDSRLSADTVAAMKADKVANRNLLSFYARYMSRSLHGDFGFSSALGRPVRELIAERIPETLKICGLGIALGCTLGFLVACATALARSEKWDVLAGGVAGLLLCIPAAVVALSFVFLRAPAGLAIAAVIFPKVYRYARNLLGRAYEMPHVLMARATGSGPVRVLFWHVLPVCATQFAAIIGISVSLALSASIPIESLCGIPGIGQLAWQSALARDLPVLVTLTVLIAAITILSNSLSDLVPASVRGRES
jgi:peptide/nickel transport system permease protein